jgi:hypothetical protein
MVKRRWKAVAQGGEAKAARPRVVEVNGERRKSLTMVFV